MRVVPLVVILGNSQCATVRHTYLEAPEYAPTAGTATFPSTLDDRQQVWMPASQSWQVLDVARNLTGWHNTAPGNVGIGSIVSRHAADRWGSCHLLHLPSNGATVCATGGSAGTFDPDVPDGLLAAAGREFAAAVGAIFAAGMLPRVVLSGLVAGENDTNSNAWQFGAKVEGIIRTMRGWCPALATDEPPPHFLTRVSPYHPGGSDAELETVQRQTDEVAGRMPHVFVVGGGSFFRPSDHRGEFQSATGLRAYPRNVRLRFGAHWTAACLQRLGQEIDRRLSAGGSWRVPPQRLPV